MILSSTVLGGGPVLIILHGLFGESKNWISIGKELAFNFEVHLIDQRNHGNSFHHSEHNYIVLSEDLYAYIKEKCIKTFSIIGHSMGGKVAMQFACLYPNHLNKLIIVDIAPKNYNENHDQIFKGLKEVLLSSNSRKVAHQILKNYIDEIAVINFLLKGLYFSKNKEPVLKFNLNSLEKNINNMLSFLLKKDTFKGLVYFLSGSKSNYIKSSDIKYISKPFPLYKIIKIEDAGHWIHIDQKEQFLNTINKILK